jgi:hypothetical protein
MLCYKCATYSAFRATDNIRIIEQPRDLFKLFYFYILKNKRTYKNGLGSAHPAFKCRMDVASVTTGNDIVHVEKE